MYTLRIFGRILSRDLANLLTNAVWLVLGIGFPIALVLVIGFLASGGYGDDVTSYDYFGVSLMIYATFNAATFAANSFMEERIQSANMRLVRSPVPRGLIPLSKVVATFIFSTLCSTVAAGALALIVGVDYGGERLEMIWTLMALSCLLFSSLGIAVCCLLRSERSANQVLGSALALIAALGGLFFPVEGLGAAIGAISRVSPATWLLHACMQIIYDRDGTWFAPVAVALAALAAILCALSLRLFNGEDYL